MSTPPLTNTPPTSPPPTPPPKRPRPEEKISHYVKRELTYQHTIEQSVDCPTCIRKMLEDRELKALRSRDKFY